MEKIVLRGGEIGLREDFFKDGFAVGARGECGMGEEFGGVRLNVGCLIPGAGSGGAGENVFGGYDVGVRMCGVEGPALDETHGDGERALHSWGWMVFCALKMDFRRPVPEPKIDYKGNAMHCYPWGSALWI